MKPDHVKHLLGGYATGTLTPEERKALFDAALQNQDLFEALASEQSLKEALDQPTVRRELIEVLESRRSSGERLGAWMRWPYSLAAASALAVAALTAIAIVRYNGSPAQPRQTTEISQLRTPPVVERMEKGSDPAEGSKPAARPSSTARAMPERQQTVAQSLQPPAALDSPAPANRALPAPPAQAATAPAPSAPPPQARTALASAEAAQSMQARSLFYGFVQQPAAPAGVAGGVVGGFPAAPMRSTRSKAVVVDSATASDGALGLRYQLREVQGSPAQLLVESNADAVLYIFRRGAAGEWMPVTAGGMSLKGRVPATTPPVAIDGDAPLPRAVLVLSRAPLTQLAQAGAELSATIEKLRIQNESVPLLTQVAGGSTYVVTPRPTAIIVTPLGVP